MKKKGWTDYVADLLSGRIYNTLILLHNAKEAHSAEIQTVKDTIMNNAEQKLLDAATTLNEVGQNFEDFANSMKEKVAKLTAQAESPFAAENPVNLEEEFAVFDEAVNKLKTMSSGLGQDASASGTGNPAVVPNPANVGGGITAVPYEAVPSEPIPLAGESGISNTPTDSVGNLVEVGGGEVFAAQPQPGSTIAPEFAAVRMPLPAATDESASEMEEDVAEDLALDGVSPTGTSNTDTGGNPFVLDETIGNDKVDEDEAPNI